MEERSVSPPPIKRRRSMAPTAAFAPTLPSRPLTILGPSHLRIFTWNVNGISPFLQPSITSFFQKSPKKRPRSPSPESKSSQSPSLRACLRRWKWPQVLCLQEVKIAPTDSKSQGAIQQAIKAPPGSAEPGYKAYFSLPRDKFNARGFGGKVYGVCTLVQNGLVDESSLEGEKVAAKSVEWDLEGRVLELRMPKHKLVVFNVYAVNGTDNLYRDPKTGEIAGTRHERKRAFHTQLRDTARNYEEKDWSVIIAGDLNIARSSADGFPGIRLAQPHTENRRDFETKFMESLENDGSSMADSFRALHSQERKYTYRSQGRPWGSSCDRVDLILLSTRIMKMQDALLEADILDEQAERGPSDHLPSYVTVDLGRMF